MRGADGTGAGVRGVYCGGPKSNTSAYSDSVFGAVGPTEAGSWIVLTDAVVATGAVGCWPRRSLCGWG